MVSGCGFLLNTGFSNRDINSPALAANLISEDAHIAGSSVSQPVIADAEPLMSEQWGLLSMNIPSLWQHTSGGADVVVAVLDSGIDSAHPDLFQKVLKSVNFTDSETVNDAYGHGTAVASIIASAVNGAGMTGIAPDAFLLNVKVADDKGKCDAAAMARGIIWAVDEGAHIINISIQITYASPELEQAVVYAHQKGVVIVAASGNNTPGINIYPAYYASTVAVSAITPENKLSPLANYADWVDFVAPGYQVVAANNEGGYSLRTGTSFAAPHLSGLIALLLGSLEDSPTGNNRAEQLRQTLELAADPLNMGGYQGSTVNTDKLILMLSSAS
jgi:subtilisin family serine protease